MEKVKIILDADVLLHFAKAGRLNMLPEILPEYGYLDLTPEEVTAILQESM